MILLFKILCITISGGVFPISFILDWNDSYFTMVACGLSHLYCHKFLDVFEYYCILFKYTLAYLCVVNFAYAISKWSTIFKFVTFVSAIVLPWCLYLCLSSFCWWSCISSNSYISIHKYIYMAIITKT